MSLVDAGRPTAFSREVEFPTVEAARAFVPPPFWAKKDQAAIFHDAYWHATRGSGRRIAMHTGRLFEIVYLLQAVPHDGAGTALK
ncbi:MAG: hypothetical protein ACLR7U_01330 [Ruthenibacterium lactatiformans]